MSSTLRVTNVSDTTGGTSTNLMSGLAKAWSVYDQVNTTVDDSFNISSVTDRGTGSMYHNYSNSFDGLRHCVTASTSPSAPGSMSVSNYNRVMIASGDTTGRSSTNSWQPDPGIVSDEEANQVLSNGDLS